MRCWLQVECLRRPSATWCAQSSLRTTGSDPTGGDCPDRIDLPFGGTSTPVGRRHGLMGTGFPSQDPANPHSILATTARPWAPPFVVSSMAQSKTPRQLDLFRWGGRRRGAGRKPKGARPGVSRRTREDFPARHPLLVTVRMRAGLPSLRAPHVRRALFDALRAVSETADFRVVHASVQTNHYHLICESSGAFGLERGLRSLGLRTQWILREYFDARGRVQADRPHVRELRTPSEVRNALRYVLNNGRRHGTHFADVDPCSTGPWFDGWSRRITAPSAERPLPSPGTWLLGVGWRRRGLIEPRETPRAPARGSAGNGQRARRSS